MFLRLAGAAVVLVALVAATWFAAATYTERRGTNPAAVEATVRDYLLRQPEVLVEAMQRLQARRNEEAQWALTAVLSELKTELRQDPHSPVGGNPQGDVTIVEFFDYNCPYCKQAHPLIADLMQKDPKLRRVYKELPVLGPGSSYASRFALAVHLEAPEKYVAFHNALYDIHGEVTQELVWAAVQQLGLDLATIKARADTADVINLIDRNLSLARKLGLQGTPAFVIGDTMFLGYVESPQLVLAIQQARRGCESC